MQEYNYFNNYTHVDISGGEEFIKIFYTTENLSLSEIPQQTYCQSNSAQEYAPSIAITKKIVFEKKLLSLFDRYNDYYLDLKEDFRIPKDTDFSFSFTFVNETNITTGDVEVLADVFVGEYLIPYLDSDANVVFGVLEIKLW